MGKFQLSNFTALALLGILFSLFISYLFYLSPIRLTIIFSLIQVALVYSLVNFLFKRFLPVKDPRLSAIAGLLCGLVLYLAPFVIHYTLFYQAGDFLGYLYIYMSGGWFFFFRPWPSNIAVNLIFEAIEVVIKVGGMFWLLRDSAEKEFGKVTSKSLEGGKGVLTRNTIVSVVSLALIYILMYLILYLRPLAAWVFSI